MRLSTAERQKIIDWIREARSRLALTTHSVSLEWDTKRTSGSAMDIKMNGRYNAGYITIYEHQIKAEWEKLGDSSIRFICYHEMVHLLLMEVDERAESRFGTKEDLTGALERLTEKLTHLFLPDQLDVQYTRNSVLKKNTMPKGAGTYGSQVGRPPKKKKKKK